MRKFKCVWLFVAGLKTLNKYSMSIKNNAFLISRVVMHGLDFLIKDNFKLKAYKRLKRV